MQEAGKQEMPPLEDLISRALVGTQSSGEVGKADRENDAHRLVLAALHDIKKFVGGENGGTAQTCPAWIQQHPLPACPGSDDSVERKNIQYDAVPENPAAATTWNHVHVASSGARPAEDWRQVSLPRMQACLTFPLLHGHLTALPGLQMGRGSLLAVQQIRRLANGDLLEPNYSKIWALAIPLGHKPWILSLRSIFP